MAEQVPADVRLHQDAEGMPPVADHVLQSRPQQVGGHHHHNDGEKGPVEALRDELVHTQAGDVGKGQVDQRDQQRAGHIQQEELFVRAEIAEKDAQQAVAVKVALRHRSPPAK